jgi:uncharacterized protein (UPF0264 family)
MVVAERWGVRDGDPSDDGVVLATRGEKLLRPGPPAAAALDTARAKCDYMHVGMRPWGAF